MKPKQVLQQPNTGDAVNRWNSQGDPADFAIREVQQPLLERRVIQIRPAFGWVVGWTPDPHAWMRAEFVKLSKPALRQQIVHNLAAPAAKNLFSLAEGVVRTRLATVKAGGASRRNGAARR